MKTIAVVTMVFLPGTFLATLWAVPSLQWEQTPVIQGNFWVYWVFALPFTAFVLVIWHLFTRQKRYLTLWNVHDKRVPQTTECNT
jgi:Mg2+ and Co2+ transporter CorA